MRILVLLDPTNKRDTKKAYTDLRTFLKTDGYLRIGTELYPSASATTAVFPRQ